MFLRKDSSLSNAMYKNDPLQLLNDLLGAKHFEPQIFGPKWRPWQIKKEWFLVKMTMFYFKSICNHKKYTEGLSLKVFSKGQNTSCIVCWGRNLTSEACPISMYKFPWFVQQFISMGSKIISLSLKKKVKFVDHL